jgi:periplasmic protein TonB
MNNKPLHKANFDDAVFEGRNKEYGAYELRNLYGKRLMTAFSIAVILVLIIILYPKKEVKPDQIYTVDEVVLSPLKKIKTPLLPEKELAPEPPPEEKKPEIKKPEVVEKVVTNESKVVVVEKSISDKKAETTTNTKPTEVNSGNKTQATNTGNQTEEGLVDAESITVPAIFPGCEKFTDKKKILSCFNEKINQEITYFLEGEDWKKKSVEQIYFEIDRQGNISNVKFLTGPKINDGLATKSLSKIAMDFNKRTNPKRRIQPGVNAFGKPQSVQYSIPVSFLDPTVD